MIVGEGKRSRSKRVAWGWGGFKYRRVQCLGAYGPMVQLPWRRTLLYCHFTLLAAMDIRAVSTTTPGTRRIVESFNILAAGKTESSEVRILLYCKLLYVTVRFHVCLWTHDVRATEHKRYYLHAPSSLQLFPTFLPQF